MHINSHFTPANFGASSRPDHAANPSGRGHQFEVAPEDAQSTAATATEETAETAASDIPGRSVAHQARGHLATLQGLEGHNFGWLVSQIAQGNFNTSAYETPDEGAEGEGGESAVASTEETGEGETTTAATETTAASEEDTTTSTDEAADETTEGTTEAVADLVDDLVDDLLEDNEDDSEVT